MMQFSIPLPSDIPACAQGHRPQLVETRGNASNAGLGMQHPSTWHIECLHCAIASRPNISRAITELRWRMQGSEHIIPLHQLRAARAEACAAAAHAAAA